MAVEGTTARPPAPAPSPPPSAAPASRARSPQRLAPLLVGSGLVLVAALPLVLTALRLDEPFVHVADVALVDLQARQLTDDLPLLGPYSRFGWRHPGPLYGWVLGVVQVLTGGSSRAVFLAALAVNTACVAGIALVLRRAMGAPAALAGLAALLGWALVLEPEHTLSPWGPHAVALPLALLVVSCGAVLVGHRWCLVPAVVAGSLAVQTHVGLGPAVAALAVVTALAVAVRSVRRRRGEHFAGAPRARLPLLVATALALALWAPPLLEEQLEHPGNLTALAEFATDPPEDQEQGHAAGDALDGVLRGMASPLPGWLDARWALTGVAAAASALALLALVGRGARRARAGTGVATVALGWLVLGVAVLSGTQVVGELYAYLFFWTGAAAAVVVVAGAAALAARWPLLRFVALAAVAVLGALLVRQFAADDGAAYRSAAGVAELTDHADEVLAADGAESVLVDIVGPAWPKAVGIAGELERRGYDVRLDRAAARVFDPSLLTDGEEDACLVVDEVERRTRPLRSVRGAEVVTSRRTAVAVLANRCAGVDQPLVAASETPMPPGVSAP